MNLVGNAGDTFCGILLKSDLMGLAAYEFGSTGPCIDVELVP